MTLQPGTRLGPYEIVASIGAGGMGEVWRAKDTRLEGESLADRIKKGPLPLGDVLKYGQQIPAALDAAHRRGITHRDLKPGNIMPTKTGAKLLDFGLARTAAQAQAPVDGLTSLVTNWTGLLQKNKT